MDITGPASVAEAAEWAMTDVMRRQLAPKGIHVAGLHVGYMDTDMASYVAPENKADPAMVASAALDGLASNAAEILADEHSRATKRNLSAPVTV
ncbi:hypothetical protein [Streptosporangium album]